MQLPATFTVVQNYQPIEGWWFDSYFFFFKNCPASVLRIVFEFNLEIWDKADKFRPKAKIKQSGNRIRRQDTHEVFLFCLALTNAHGGHCTCRGPCAVCAIHPRSLRELNGVFAIAAVAPLTHPCHSSEIGSLQCVSLAHFLAERSHIVIPVMHFPCELSVPFVGERNGRNVHLHLPVPGRSTSQIEIRRCSDNTLVNG